MKTKLIALFVVLLSASWSSAQTAEETVSWLQAKMAEAYKFEDLIRLNIITKNSFVNVFSYKGDERDGAIEVKYAKVSAISWKRAGDDLMLAFAGSFTSFREFDKREEYAREKYDWNEKPVNSAVVALKPSLSDADVTRIVKAFSHLAELAGAKLVKEDLF